MHATRAHRSSILPPSYYLDDRKAAFDAAPDAVRRGTIASRVRAYCKQNDLAIPAWALLKKPRHGNRRKALGL